MITYFRMKKREWKMKAMFYDAILKVVDERKGIVEAFKRAYNVLKDSNAEDVQAELVKVLAELVHEENAKKRADAKE